MFRVEATSYVYTGPQPGFIKAEESYDCHMVLAVETGSYDYAVGGESGSASFGDLVFTPPHTSFKRRAHGDITFHLIAFHPVEEAEPTSGRIPAGKVTLRDVNRLASTFAYMRNRYREAAEPAGGAPAFGLVSHMLADLLYMCDIELAHAARRSRTVDPLMQQAAGHIQRYVHGDISMRGIADRLGIQPSELTRRFRLAYGCTPIEYATGLRLEEAKRLLIETTDTLEAIADRCGYDNGSYLSRIFRAKTGMPPSEFRRRHQF